MKYLVKIMAKKEEEKRKVIWSSLSYLTMGIGNLYFGGISPK